MTVPSADPTRWVVLTVDDVLTTPTRSVSPPTLVRLYLCVHVDTEVCHGVLLQNLNIAHRFFRRPKHQSEENFVCPAIMKDSVTVL